MVSQSKLDSAYMDCARSMASLSYAVRKKVGAILVAPNGGIIAEGINGTPSGFENVCEDNIFHQWELNCGRCMTCKSEYTTDKLCKSVTKPEVLHAESNAIAKIAKSANSSLRATLYVTMSPCFECSKLIIQCGITRVVYDEEYRITDGIDLLLKAGVQVEKIK